MNSELRMANSEWGTRGGKPKYSWACWMDRMDCMDEMDTGLVIPAGRKRESREGWQVEVSHTPTGASPVVGRYSP